MEIKPCPFCKSENVGVSYPTEASYGAWVECHSCQARGPVAYTWEVSVKNEESRDEAAVRKAIRRWNIREGG